MTAGPFNGPHYYVQWGGTLPGGDEWSNGLRLVARLGVTSLPDYSSVMHTAVTDAIKAWHSGATTFISPRAVLTHVKLNKIDASGHYALPTTNEQLVANLPGSGAVANTPPNQVCLAISLTTDFSRGPAHRGRFYSPLPTLPVQADGRITSGDRDAVRDSAHDLLTALNNANPNLQVGIMSRKLGAPTSNFVVGIEVGRVLDTQRRRRNKLVEAYS